MGKSETEKAKTPQKTRKEKPLYPTKVVIRRLPPSLTEDRFKEELGEIPPHDFFYFVGSNMSFSPVPFSRAYINFKNPEDIVKFRDQFDGYLFVGERGVEHPAVVEYAPYQGVPKKRSRKDAKCGTIEKDPDYLAFLESLKEKAEPLPSIEVHLEEIEAKKLKKDGSKFPKVTTPLLEYLKMKRNTRNNSRPSSRVSPEKKKRAEKDELPKPVKKSFSQSSVSSSSKFGNSDSSRNDKHKDLNKTEKKGNRGKDESHGKEKQDKRGGKDTKSRPGPARGSRRYDERRDREDHPDRGQRGNRGGGRRDHSRQDHEYDEWPKIKSVDSRKKTPEDSPTAKGSGKPERVERPTGTSKEMDTRSEKEGKSATSKVKPVEEKGSYERKKSEREREAKLAEENRSKMRNKDRPDRAIYQPRSHSAKHTESPEKEKSKDTRPTSDKKEYRKRGDAERSEMKQGRDDWDHYRSDRDHDRSRERKRDRGSRQRDRDRDYKERKEREYKGDHPHERDGGKGHDAEKVRNREMKKEPSKEKHAEKKEAKSRGHTGAQDDSSQG